MINKTEFENILKKAYNDKIKKNGIIIKLNNMTSSELKTLSHDITTNPSFYNGVAKLDFNYNFVRQIINAKPDKGVIEGLKSLKDKLRVKYPNLNIENISIQCGEGIFDLKPFIKL